MGPKLAVLALVGASLQIIAPPTSAEGSLVDIDFGRVKATFTTLIPPDIEAWVAQRGGTVVLRNQTLKLVAIELTEGSGGQMINDLRGRGDVDEATHDARVHDQHVRSPLDPNPPNDPRFALEQYGPPLIQLGLAGSANDGWDYERGSSSIILAIVDSGVDSLHEDLVVPCTPHCAGAGTDVTGHGTHVAGIAAAQANNLKGIAGVAQVNLMSIHRGVHFSGLAVALLEAAMRGAKVINVSAGGLRRSGRAILLRRCKGSHDSA